MPGVPKGVIVGRLSSMLERSGADLRFSQLAEGRRLPWSIEVAFPDQRVRSFRVYVWTVGHGGRSRASSEYRIQTKLGGTPEFAFGDSATTVLLGYYDERVDVSGKAIGNTPPDGMEIVVAWDPILHLKLGVSSSCQVSLDLLERSHLVGATERTRSLAGGDVETVIAMRPEYFARYLATSTGGHRFASVQAMTSSRAQGWLS